MKDNKNRCTNIREMLKEENRKTNAFDHSRIANFSDDMLGVLGWKGTVVLVVIIGLGFIIYQAIFN